MDLVSSYTAPAVEGSGPTSYTYNVDKQLTTEALPGGRSVGVGYDGAGRFDTLSFSAGLIDFDYNATTGSIASIAAPGGLLALTFDGPLQTGSAWSGTVTGTVTRTFDGSLRVGSETADGSAVTFTYDGDGLMTRAGHAMLTRHAQHGLITRVLLGADEDFTYSALGELSRQLVTRAANELYDAQFTRDALGRITVKREAIDGVLRTFGYTYDDAGRIPSVACHLACYFRAFAPTAAADLV